MSVKVSVPPAMRDLTNGRSQVEVQGQTVAEIFDALEASFPGGKERLCDPNGEIKPHTTVFVNGQDIRRLQGMGTPVPDGATVMIIAAMTGGQAS